MQPQPPHPVLITGPLARDSALRQLAEGSGNPYHEKATGRFTTGRSSPEPRPENYPTPEKYAQAKNKYDYGPGGDMPPTRAVSSWKGKPSWAIRGQTTLSLIDQIHTLPAAIRTIPFHSPGASLSLTGNFSYTYDANGTPIPTKIVYNEFDPEAENTAAHEFGHYIDSQLKPKPSEDPALTQALQNSPTAKTTRKTLTKAISDAKNPRLTPNERSIAEQTAKYLQYQTNPAEMFARAYAQYIGTKARAKDPTIYNQTLKTTKSSNPLERLNQWPPKEFTRISVAFDALLKKKGLLKSPNPSR